MEPNRPVFSSANVFMVVFTIFLSIRGALADNICSSTNSGYYYCESTQFCCGKTTCCALWWPITIGIVVVIGIALCIFKICRHRALKKQQPQATTIVGGTPPPGYYVMNGPGSNAPPPYDYP